MSKENTQVLKQRREKAEALADLGVNLYSNDFKPNNRIQELPPKGEHLEAESQDEANYTHQEVCGADRIVGSEGGRSDKPDACVLGKRAIHALESIHQRCCE